MKKVTLFIASLTSGGAEHQIAFLSDFLAERGYDVSLVTYSEIGDHYYVNEKVKRVRLAENKPIWMKLLFIFTFFIKLKTDCVISFGTRDNCFCLIPLLFRPKVKCVVSERCAFFGKMKWHQYLNYYFLYKRATRIVTNSYAQKKDIIKAYPKYEKKILTITNYTDINLYHVVNCPSNDRIRIGIFCRYVPQKNCERFVKVVKILKQKAPAPFHIDWYGNKKTGDRENNYYTHIENLLREYEICDVITLNDHTKEVAKLIPTFDALCLPSLIEGFSNSISEYICSGKPVLCSDVADNGIMVKNGVNGFLFNPYDVNSMVDSFLRFFSLSEIERTNMGKESRALAEKLFNKDKFVQQYIDLIES